MPERNVSKVPLVIGATASVLAIVSSAVGYNTYESITFSPDPIKTQRTRELQDASEELKLISINPEIALERIETVLQVLGDQSNIDDRLQAVQQEIKSAGDQPLTPQRKDEVTLLSQEIFATARSLSIENDDKFDDAAGVFFLMDLAIITIGGWVIAAEQQAYNERRAKIEWLAEQAKKITEKPKKRNKASENI